MDFNVHVGEIGRYVENILEYIEIGELEFELAEEFLEELKREFSGEDNKLAKVMELKRVE